PPSAHCRRVLDTGHGYLSVVTVGSRGEPMRSGRRRPERENTWKASTKLALLALHCISLTGCSAGGAPSFTLFGAFFPAWLLCGLIGVVGAIVARVVFVSTGLAHTLPYQLAVCTAIGVITALLAWLVGFGH